MHPPSPWGAQSVGLSEGLRITGGEPFLNFGLLLKATRIAEEFNIPSTFWETNSAWCTDDEIATEKAILILQSTHSLLTWGDIVVGC
jgi:hypothetical protein